MTAVLRYKEQNGLSNAGLAEKLGVDETTVSKLLKRRLGLSLDTFTRALRLDIIIRYKGWEIRSTELSSGVSPDQLRLFSDLD